MPWKNCIPHANYLIINKKYLPISNQFRNSQGSSSLWFWVQLPLHSLCFYVLASPWSKALGFIGILGKFLCLRMQQSLEQWQWGLPKQHVALEQSTCCDLPTNWLTHPTTYLHTYTPAHLCITRSTWLCVLHAHGKLKDYLLWGDMEIRKLLHHKIVEYQLCTH